MKLQSESLAILMFKNDLNIYILLAAFTILVFVAFSIANFVFPHLPDNLPIILDTCSPLRISPP